MCMCLVSDCGTVAPKQVNRLGFDIFCRLFLFSYVNIRFRPDENFSDTPNFTLQEIKLKTLQNTYIK